MIDENMVWIALALAAVWVIWAWWRVRSLTRRREREQAGPTISSHVDSSSQSPTLTDFETRTETARRAAESEAARRAAQTTPRPSTGDLDPGRRAAQAETARQAAAAAQRAAEEEAQRARQAREAELAREEAEQAALRREWDAEVARRAAEDEQARQREMQAEAARRAARAEASRLAAEAEAARLAAEAEAARLKAEQDAERERQASSERLRAEEELRSRQMEAERQRLSAEAEDARLRAEREAVRRAQEAEREQRQAEAEAARRAAELLVQQTEPAAAAPAEAAAQDALRDAASSQTPPTGSSARPSAPGQTLVMVADDSKVVRVKTSRLLAQHGYRVVLAEDGADAARKIDAEPPHVLITDVDMPGMDGFELTRRVRSHPTTADILVVMITAANDRHAAQAASAGVSVLLGKPYSEELLLGHIATVHGAIAELA